MPMEQVFRLSIGLIQMYKGAEVVGAVCRPHNSSVNTELSPPTENLLAAFPSDSPCLTSTRSIGIVIFAFGPPLQL